MGVPFEYHLPLHTVDAIFRGRGGSSTTSRYPQTSSINDGAIANPRASSIALFEHPCCFASLMWTEGTLCVCPAFAVFHLLLTKEPLPVVMAGLCTTS